MAKVEELLAKLRAAGVEVLQGPDSAENGSFAWILDPAVSMRYGRRTQLARHAGGKGRLEAARNR